MKTLQTWLLINMLLFSFVCFTQKEQKVKLKKAYTEVDFWPQISGYFDGEIPFSKFSTIKGLTTNADYTIISYKIRFGVLKKEHQCFGNTIHDTILAKIKQSALNNPVYFTAIKARTKTGETIHLNPLRLVPIKDEE